MMYFRFWCWTSRLKPFHGPFQTHDVNFRLIKFHWNRFEYRENFFPLVHLLCALCVFYWFCCCVTSFFLLHGTISFRNVLRVWLPNLCFIKDFCTTKEIPWLSLSRVATWKWGKFSNIIKLIDQRKRRKLQLRRDANDTMFFHRSSKRQRERENWRIEMRNYFPSILICWWYPNKTRFKYVQTAITMGKIIN